MKRVLDITLNVALIIVVLAIVITVIYVTCIKDKDKYGDKSNDSDSKR